MANEKRFVVTYTQGVLEITQVLVDTKTGVNYLFHHNGDAGGLTPLLDENGKPVITVPEKK